MYLEPNLFGGNRAVRDGRGCSQARLARLENEIHFHRYTQGVALCCHVLAIQAVEKIVPMAMSKKNHRLTKKFALCRLKSLSAA
jgi:hypothetical protein